MMYPTRLLRPLAWIRFAFFALVVSAIAVLAFVNGSPFIGWIASAVLAVYTALRIVLVVILRRAIARAVLNPPTPPTLEQRMRRFRIFVVTYLVGFGIFAASALSASFFVTGESVLITRFLAVCFAVFGVAIVVRAQIAFRRLLATQATA
jgi:hypothetical protein